MCVSVFACLYVCVMVSDLGVTDSCELPCRCWELNPGPLEEWSVLLTTEPFLQPPKLKNFNVIVSMSAPLPSSLKDVNLRVCPNLAPFL